MTPIRIHRFKTIVNSSYLGAGLVNQVCCDYLSLYVEYSTGEDTCNKTVLNKMIKRMCKFHFWLLKNKYPAHPQF
jgi:hypothetical protein